VPGTATDKKTRHSISPLLRLRQYDYGWSIIYYGPNGQVRHLASVDDEVRAFRTAREIARLYHIKGSMLVESHRGDYLYDIGKLLSEGHHEPE